MKLRLLIQIAVVVSIVLLCTGFGVYSFLRLNSVENRQDFNLYTLVPQDATAILETDRMADLVEDINELNCSKDNHFYTYRSFVYLKKYLYTLVEDTPHGLSKQMNKMLISFHEPDTPMNQVLYCSLGSGDYELVESLWRSTAPVRFLPSISITRERRYVSIPWQTVVSWLPTSLPISGCKFPEAFDRTCD